jgi:DNA primase catalytic core
MIAQTTIEKIKDAMSVVDVTADFGVTLKRAGTLLEACCPFHGEKSASFKVYPNSGTYKCFGCGEWGDAISFVMKQGNKTYPNALRYLATKYGIEVEETDEKPEVAAQFERKQILRTVMRVAQNEFLKNADKGVTYFKTRGFSEETLQEFGIGFSTGDDIRALGYDAATKQACGLINEAEKPIIWQRVTIPIHDNRGELVAFAGRTLGNTEGAKYINSKESELYQKSRVLFNFHNARKAMRDKKRVFITEGYPDVMIMNQEGYYETVATCGTALTEAHVELLRREFKDVKITVFLAFNNDKGKAMNAGQEATIKAIPMLLPFFNVRVVNLSNKDLLDCYNAKSLNLAEVLGDHVDAIDFLVKLWNGDTDAAKDRSPIEQADIQSRIAGVIAKVDNDSARDLYINDLADLLRVKPKRFGDMVETSRGQATQAKSKQIAKSYQHIKIKDDFFECQPQYDIVSKSSTMTYVRRSAAELERETWKGYLKSVPRFHNLICIPSHTDFKQEVEFKIEGTDYKFFNEYKPLPFKAKEFDLPEGWTDANFDYEQIPQIRYTAKFYKHIFNTDKYGSKYVKLGWDYFAIMFLYPERSLQARCFVSTEEATGKSTLFYYEQAFYGQNATKTTAKRLIGNFNGDLASKVLIAIEETKDDKGSIENDLKDLITGQEKIVEQKFQDARRITSFEKYLFLSNHPESFMKVGTATTRFAVIDVPSVKEKDNNLLDKMIREIPYVMYFLQKRGVLTPDTDRLWFDPTLWENEALLNLRQASKDIVVQNIELLIADIFIKANWCKPEIRLGGKLIGKYMTLYAGQKYRDHVPTYFTQTCKNAMSLRYKDKPTSYPYPKIHSFSEGESWLCEEARDKDRYIIFPIWKFLTAEEVVDEFGKDKADALVRELRGINHSTEREAQQFADAIDLRLGKKMLVQGEIDF